jgi:hypothetical protein
MHASNHFCVFVVLRTILRRWIETQYGAGTLKTFGHMDVHCSGTTMVGLSTLNHS